ncbi:hypothetical protein BQ8482_100091 [Mesorhizobium delmotii]|uniref:Uncharacterized protein n=1 Tax=Mesorhizobium delmotii TaxID=1631247 RepID=A0A2P9A9W3_9HYPH|nr:hypothetical protein BQ8482_100091 [Mesorhizobium delmotii]
MPARWVRRRQQIAAGSEVAIRLADTEAFEPFGIGLGADTPCFLMQPEYSGYQHSDGHCGGEHVDQHVRVLPHLATIKWGFGFIF